MTTSLETAPVRLNGWKEIAAYLGKGSRTVQRWEKLYGLPVHRVGREGGEIVFAFRDEIDRWASSSREAASRDAVSDGAEAEAPTSDPRETGAQPVPAPQARRLPPRWLWLAAAAALALPLLLRALPPAGRGATSRPPAAWKLENERLVVLDDTGAVLFEHAFGFAMSRSASSAVWNEIDSAPVLIADLEGDGRPEVLVMPLAAARENRRLYCFEADGRLRFVHQPTGRAVYGDREYAEPWLAHRMVVTEGPGGERSLWAVFTHNLWFPTRLRKLGPQGAVLGEYWSAGYVETVAEATWQGRPVLLVGGVNNELKGASLTLFDRSAFGGRAPASKAEYACTSCPAGGPREVLVFPTLCVFARKGGIAGLHEAWVEGDDRLVVQVTQALGDLDGGATPGHAVVHYTLDRDLVPVLTSISPEFQSFHRLLEKQGVLDHELGPEDAAAVLPVRRWDGTRFAELPRGKVER